jgi:hypothetical protein
MSLKHELQDIISGNGTVRFGEAIQSAKRFIRGKKETIQGIEETKQFQIQEAQILTEYIDQNNLWITDINPSSYIGEGAEQKVYESSDPDFIIKLNDRIFYACWEDYFSSLLLHNYFFPHLAYELLGFHMAEAALCAVVKQHFVKSTGPTNLENVKTFVESNGFVQTRINNYHHPQLGIIIEDLHDENVLTEEGTLQFIDTVFYLTPVFFRPD